MRVPKSPPRHPLRLAAAVVAALLLPALAAPAAAADDDVSGWFAMLDVALSQPTSLDQKFMTVFDFASSPVMTETLAIENDSDVSYRAGFGYSFGGGLGSLQVSYWTFDNDDNRTGSIASYSIGYPNVFGTTYGYYVPPGYSYGYPQVLLGTPIAPILYDARSSTKASTIDVDYVRPMKAGEKLTVSWLAGLRAANFEEELTFTGSDASSSYDQSRLVESDAIGLRFGARAAFGFTEHFRMEGGLAISFLQADVESTAQQGDTGSTPDVIRRGSDDNVRGEIRDLDLRAVWRSGPVDYYIGYTMSTWDGLVADPSPGRVPVDSSRGDRDAVAFNSWQGGLVVRFGGGP